MHAEFNSRYEMPHKSTHHLRRDKQTIEVMKYPHNSMNQSSEIYKHEKMHVQSVKNYCFPMLNMQICDAFVAVAIVVV